jgi:hypothetical protein
MRKKIIASLLFGVFISIQAEAADSYDFATGVLAIPLVKVWHSPNFVDTLHNAI